MGFYIDPANMSREDWLQEYGTFEGCITEALTNGSATSIYESHRCKNEVVVVLVANGPFTAARIAFDLDEFKAFVCNKKDKHRMIIYSVPTDDILRICYFVRDHLKESGYEV